MLQVKSMEEMKASKGKMQAPHDAYCVIECNNCDCNPPPNIILTQEINVEVLKDIIDSCK